MFEPDETLQAFTRYKDRDRFPSGRNVSIGILLVLALTVLAVYLL